MWMPRKNDNVLSGGLKIEDLISEEDGDNHQLTLVMDESRFGEKWATSNDLPSYETVKKFKKHLLSLACISLLGLRRMSSSHVAHFLPENRPVAWLHAMLGSLCDIPILGPKARLSHESYFDLLKVVGFSDQEIFVWYVDEETPRMRVPGRSLAKILFAAGSSPILKVHPKSPKDSKISDFLKVIDRDERYLMREYGHQNGNTRKLLEFTELPELLEDLIVDSSFAERFEFNDDYWGRAIIPTILGVIGEDRGVEKLTKLRQALIIIMADALQLLYATESTERLQKLMNSKVPITEKSVEEMKMKLGVFLEAVLPVICYTVLCDLSNNPKLLGMEEVFALLKKGRCTGRVRVKNLKKNVKNMFRCQVKCRGDEIEMKSQLDETLRDQAGNYANLEIDYLLTAMNRTDLDLYDKIIEEESMVLERSTHEMDPVLIGLKKTTVADFLSHRKAVDLASEKLLMKEEVSKTKALGSDHNSISSEDRTRPLTASDSRGQIEIDHTPEKITENSGELSEECVGSSEESVGSKEGSEDSSEHEESIGTLFQLFMEDLLFPDLQKMNLEDEQNSTPTAEDEVVITEASGRSNEDFQGSKTIQSASEQAEMTAEGMRPPEVMTGELEVDLNETEPKEGVSKLSFAGCQDFALEKMQSGLRKIAAEEPRRLKNHLEPAVNSDVTDAGGLEVCASVENIIEEADDQFCERGSPNEVHQLSSGSVEVADVGFTRRGVPEEDKRACPLSSTRLNSREGSGEGPGLVTFHDVSIIHHDEDRIGGQPNESNLTEEGIQVSNEADESEEHEELGNENEEAGDENELSKKLNGVLDRVSDGLKFKLRTYMLHPPMNVREENWLKILQLAVDSRGLYASRSIGMALINATFTAKTLARVFGGHEGPIKDISPSAIKTVALEEYSVIIKLDEDVLELKKGSLKYFQMMVTVEKRFDFVSDLLTFFRKEDGHQIREEAAEFVETIKKMGNKRH